MFLSPSPLPSPPSLSFFLLSPAIPLSMLRLSRVNLRRRLGPTRMNTLSSMGLPPHIVDFMQNILGLCDDYAQFKAMAVRASSVEIPLKSLNSHPNAEPLPAKTSM